MSISIHLIRLPAPGAYARDWRKLVWLAKHEPDCRITARSFGHDMPVEPAELVQVWRRALQNRINDRGGFCVRGLSDHRLHRLRADHGIRHECKWCGADVGYQRHEYQRFCSDDCRCSYFG